MNPSFHIIDFVIVGIYAILLVGVGLWVSRTKKGHTKTAEDYFLASKALPWWAIGSSRLPPTSQQSNLSVCPVQVLPEVWLLLPMNLWQL